MKPATGVYCAGQVDPEDPTDNVGVVFSLPPAGSVSAAAFAPDRAWLSAAPGLVGVNRLQGVLALGGKV